MKSTKKELENQALYYNAIGTVFFFVDKKNSNLKKKAWLVLSHAGWFGLTIGINGITFTLITFNPQILETKSLQNMTIGLSIFAIISSLWIIYIIYKTWEFNNKLTFKLFDDIGFILLMILAIITFGFTIWTLVIVITNIFK